jgi:kynurenine formamidase
VTARTAPRPRFAELPVIDGSGFRHAWDAYGRKDQLGSVNLLTAERTLAAAQLVSQGRVICLSLPLNEPSPPLFRRGALAHEVIVNRVGCDERLDNFNPQSSSQWDGLGHFRLEESGYYGGRREDPVPGGGEIGVEHWAEHGIAGRGVLLDVPRKRQLYAEPYDPMQPEEIEARELALIAECQGVQLRPGDVLCVRFGWTQAYYALSAAERRSMAQAGLAISFAGLAPDEEMAAFLWDCAFGAVACDNPAVEAWGPDAGMLHRRAIPCLGLAFGELFDFEQAARYCHEAGTWEFMFVAAPLRLVGGVGSSANALAIF